MPSLVALLLGFHGCVAHVQHAPASLGDLEAIAGNAVHAADLYAAAAQLLPSQDQAKAQIKARAVDAMTSLQRDLVAERALEHYDVLSAGGVCPTCPKEYEALCPDAWAHGDDGVCAAPPSYEGPCRAYGYFTGMSQESKQQFERRCAACWPCSSVVPGGAVPNGPVGVGHGSVAAGFLASHPRAANIRLQEPQGAPPDSRVSSDLMTVLGALEERQQLDEAQFSSIASSWTALAHALS